MNSVRNGFENGWSKDSGVGGGKSGVEGIEAALG